MAGPSIAVAGGGLIGLSIGWKLAQAGFKVTIFEKNTLGAEASWAGAGMLAPGGEVDAPSRQSTLALTSRRSYPDFVRALERASGQFIDYQECGALDLAFDEQQWSVLQSRAAQQRALGIASREVSLAQVAAFWPRVRSTGLRGALFYPDDALVNPREMTAALEAACRRLGVCIREHAGVDAMESQDNGATIVSSGERHAFAAVVVAAGAWSGAIPVANLPPLPPSAPVRGHLVAFAQPLQTCHTILRHGHSYLLQRANGQLIAGASIEHAGWNRVIDPEIARALSREAEFVMPHLAETTPSEAWLGFRPASDELHIGPWASSPHVFLAYGHYRNGILLAPVTAAAISEQISASLGKPLHESASLR